MATLMHTITCHNGATCNPYFPFTLCVAAPSTQSSWPAAYNGKWCERAIIDHMYNAALYSGGLRRWCFCPTFMSRPLHQWWVKSFVQFIQHLSCFLFFGRFPSYGIDWQSAKSSYRQCVAQERPLTEETAWPHLSPAYVHKHLIRKHLGDSNKNV